MPLETQNQISKSKDLKAPESLWRTIKASELQLLQSTCVSPGPPRSRVQDRIKHSRTSLMKTPLWEKMERELRRTGEPSGHNASLTRGGKASYLSISLRMICKAIKESLSQTVKSCHCLPGRVCLIILTLLSCLLGVAPEKVCPLWPTGFQNAVPGVLVSYAQCP